MQGSSSASRPNPADPPSRPDTSQSHSTVLSLACGVARAGARDVLERCDRWGVIGEADKVQVVKAFAGVLFRRGGPPLEWHPTVETVLAFSLGFKKWEEAAAAAAEPEPEKACLLYTSPSPRDLSTSRMPSSA